jgi:predicted glycosyltransferase
MRIVVDIGHPAHVHLFKNFVWEMEKRGHEILITTSKKDVSIQLLDAYGFDYTNLGSYGFSIVRKIMNIPVMDLRMYRAVKSFKPDIFVGMASVRAAHVSKLMRKTSITFQDTEPGIYHAKILCNLFTDAILTPSSFKKELGTKQIRYNGYHELAYLHPNYLKPNPAVLDELGLTRDDTFIILRFTAWRSHIEVGQQGIQDRTTLVRELEKYGQVFITSEGRLDGGLAKYKIKVSPEKMHDLMYYATLLYSEGATMASECAVLGTHAIYCDLEYWEKEEREVIGR